ncbi:Arp2/3 complex, 34 kD subunit p34-Arc, partial [Prunus dulcis]
LNGKESVEFWNIERTRVPKLEPSGIRGANSNKKGRKSKNRKKKKEKKKGVGTPGVTRHLKFSTSHSRFLLDTLLNRLQNIEKAVEADYHWAEFDDVRYHIQVTMKNPHILLLSVSLPTPPQETVFLGGLPSGAIEAIKVAYGAVVQILDPQEMEYKHALLVKIASVREVVLGAPLRGILKKLTSRTLASNTDGLVALVHRPNESFFLIPQAEKVTVIFPMRFKDSIDIVLATSFLQEFVEARRMAGLNTAPPCLWSPTPPLELKEAPAEALSANAGFVTFVIFPRHVEGKKLDRTVCSLSTFHAYVSYHVKCSEGFMHTRMRRRVESLIEALDRAKPGMENAKNASQSRSFKRLSLKEARELKTSRILFQIKFELQLK